MTPKTKHQSRYLHHHRQHLLEVFSAMTTFPVCCNTKIKIREEEQANVFVVEEVIVRVGMGQMQEVPVSLIPGICQVPDPDPATVTLGNENHFFVSTVRKTTINKKSVLLELKTIRLVYEMTVLPIILNNRATNSIPTTRVMRVRLNCIKFFSCRLNDPSH